MKHGWGQGQVQRGASRGQGRLAAVLLPCCLAALLVPALTAQRSGEHNDERPGPAQFQHGGHDRPGGGAGRPGHGQHLPQWLAQHQNLSPAQQENALRQEPGFGRLPGEQQQQLINRLHRLDDQPPAQRQRMLERNERFEALSPERKQAIRGASDALRQMGPERRQAVQQAFHELRVMPPEERQDALRSARYGAEYSPEERMVLSNMLSIEPYQPEQDQDH